MKRLIFCVNIDITKEFKQRVFINEEDDGTWKQDVVYENFPLRCKIYKQWDHHAKECLEGKKESKPHEQV